MAWASVKGQKVDTFTAVEQDRQIIMSGLFNGQNSRITFSISKRAVSTGNWSLNKPIKAGQRFIAVRVSRLKYLDGIIRQKITNRLNRF